MLTDNKWFLLEGGQVSGPFDSIDIEDKASKNKDVLIWGRGMSEWLPYPQWESEKDKQAPILDAAESDAPLWKLRINGTEKPPMPYQELLLSLKGLQNHSDIFVLTEGLNDWSELFAVPKLADDLGLTRRSSPRYPIMGHFEGINGDNHSVQGRVISLSEGGFGLTDVIGLKIGDKIKGSISSPNLFMSISFTCEAMFVGLDGYAGMKFVTITAESHGAIIEYLKKFETKK